MTMTHHGRRSSDNATPPPPPPPEASASALVLRHHQHPVVTVGFLSRLLPFTANDLHELLEFTRVHSSWWDTVYNFSLETWAFVLQKRATASSSCRRVSTNTNESVTTVLIRRKLHFNQIPPTVLGCPSFVRVCLDLEKSFDRQSWKLFFEAAFDGRADVLTVLCDRGWANHINSKTPNTQRTALHCLLTESGPHSEVALDVLCRAGADVNAQALDLSTPLIMACWNSTTRIVQQLLEYGASPSSSSSSAAAPERNHQEEATAAATSDDATATIIPRRPTPFLLRNNSYLSSQVNYPTSAGGPNIVAPVKALKQLSAFAPLREPLHVAAFRGSAEICSLLLATGRVDVNVCDAVGHTALHFAAAGSAPPDVIDVLIQHGAHIDAVVEYEGSSCCSCDRSFTPLGIAVVNAGEGHDDDGCEMCPRASISCAAALIKHGASIRPVTHHVNVSCGQNFKQDSQQKKLDTTKGDDDDHDRHQTANLLALTGWSSMLNLLLDAGAGKFVNDCHSGVAHPVYTQARARRWLCGKTLVRRCFEEHDIRINLAATAMIHPVSGKCLLHLVRNKLHIAQWLLQQPGVQEANLVNHKDCDGSTPLMEAAIHDDTEDWSIGELLIKHGAEINATNKSGQAFFHIACGRHNFLALRSARYHQANLNLQAQPSSGDTCLHVAARHSDIGLVQYIIKKGCVDPEITNNNGNVAAGVAGGYDPGKTGFICESLLRKVTNRCKHEKREANRAAEKEASRVWYQTLKLESAELRVGFELLPFCVADAETKETEEQEVASAAASPVVSLVRVDPNRDVVIPTSSCSVVSDDSAASDKVVVAVDVI